MEQYVNKNIVKFHTRRLESLQKLSLDRLLKKNPYLFKAKNMQSAGQFIEGYMEAFLSSSEEQMFGDFLEGLAVFVAQQTTGGHKSTAPGVDLEFLNKEVHYVVSIKSGPNWGNSSQQDKLEEDLRVAVRRLKQSQQLVNVQPVLGICYGKTRTSYMKRGYLKAVGQSFWYLISENKELYTEIVEPIGFRAKEHNERFFKQKANVENRLTGMFIERFCHESGAIDWPKLIRETCGNYGKGDRLPY